MNPSVHISRDVLIMKIHTRGGEGELPVPMLCGHQGTIGIFCVVIMGTQNCMTKALINSAVSQPLQTPEGMADFKKTQQRETESTPLPLFSSQTLMEDYQIKPPEQKRSKY